MDSRVADRLLALNREFYRDFAAHFAASRSVDDPALTAILPHLPRCGSLLDVGCGNGRLVSLLARERPGLRYLGVDAAPELLAAARARAAALTAVAVSFRPADIARPGWSRPLPRPFDCAVLLAVLHHIPGFDRRAAVLRETGSLLVPGGRLIFSTWQFLAHARLRRKIVPWETLAISQDDLEPGDYLLDWKRGGRGVRYCHLVDEGEAARLAAAAGLDLVTTFRAGGREGDVSLFVVCDVRREGVTPPTPSG